MATRVDLEGFEDVAEARAAAARFLRETKPSPKARGPLAMYDSYEATSGRFDVLPRALRELWSAFVRSWSGSSGERRA
jgi:hypothetical protein